MSKTKEEIREYQRVWRRNNPERVKAYRKQFMDTHPNYSHEEYEKRKDDPEFQRYQKEYYRNYMSNPENRAKHSEHNRMWALNHPEWIKQHKEKLSTYLKNYHKINIFYGHCPYMLYTQWKQRQKKQVWVTKFMNFETWVAFTGLFSDVEKKSMIQKAVHGSMDILDIICEIEQKGFDLHDEEFIFMIDTVKESKGKLDFIERYTGMRIGKHRCKTRDIIQIEDIKIKIESGRKNFKIWYKEEKDGQ